MKRLPQLKSLCLLICGFIAGLACINIYYLLSKNLVLENWLLEQEVNDYVHAKLEQNNA